MQASIAALQANNDHLTQLAQESQKLHSEKSRLARSNHQLSQAVLRAVTRCGEARNQVMWLNSRNQQMHANWASLLDGFEHQLDRTKTRWWMHRSLVYTGQDQQQTLVARTKALEAQLHKAQLDHLAVQRQCHSAQEERQQLQARLEHQQALVTELEDRCQFWQDKVMTLQRSVTTAIEEKSQAVMESHRVRLELEKSRVVEFTTNGSVCGSVASSRYGGQAPSVSSAVSVTSMVRARRARQHPYLMGHRASTPAPPHRMTPRSHHAIGASGTTQSSGAVTNVAHERSPPLVAPTPTPTGDQWRTTPASPSTMHPPPLPVTKSNLHKKTSEPLLFTTPTPACPAISSPLANRSPTLFSPRSRTTTRTASLLSQPSKPPPPPGCSLGGESLDQRQRTESKDLASPLVSPERRASRPSVSPSLRSADPTHALDALGPFTATGNGTSATPAGNTIASPRLLPLQRRTTDQPITVMFSGFGDTDRYAEHAPDRAYTFTTRDRLTALVSALGGNVYSEHRDFDPTCVTHLITRPTSRTLKTFAAALTGCWVITNYEWVEQSAKVGWFVDEKPFGTRYDARPFAHQQVFIAPSFEQSNQGSAAFKIDNIKALVEKYGAGQVVATATDASLCVKADWDRQSYCARDLTWAQFVALIPGSNVKPTRSRKAES
ncbi:hypothetical protein H4R35_002556 [Dimargaris xerosporica]|nr:hypothetical protein H4R35_002556 [Dimargaris xerosporica]